MGLFAGVVAFGNFIAPAPKTPDSRAPLAAASASALAEATITEPLPPPQPAGGLAPDADGNFTNNLAAFVSKNLISMNPEGPVNDNFTVKDAEVFAARAIQASVAGFNPAYFTNPEVEISRFAVRAGGDAAAYRAAATAIITGAERDFAPNDRDPMAAQMRALAAQYAAASDALYALSVPAGLENEHARNLRAMLGKQRVLEAMAHYESDPVYASLALKLWNAIK
jgi:hypothetical protein